MTPDGLLLLAAYGAACYVLGLITGARVIPWLVDQGWFPVRTQQVLPQEPVDVACTGAR